MSTEWDPEDVFSVLGDEYARAILRATSIEPRSAKVLSEECDMSRPTVSRRINTLLDHDLLVERRRYDPGGHHYSVYEARLNEVTIRLLDGHFDIRVTFREDAADRFTRIWREMRSE